ncbi:DHA1 family bicyclomycin/chloramphenicol resistance-like MFS transporter [Curtobacterium flaccumfaciens]|uniref:DHA1 family bicyclomycin/chloramphenicol resistance-like MFS transporter n=1 Tax=Curtobacterium flaccumfaciens TaxID=2035 RepID=A0A4R6DDH6_9MICO|nr:multidrug effflux MFS transporter [Curtobacterium flaccumfaciens]TDN42460.1 DHA1 family bicyclomycin/chloramphenicol resistance-like MFS transporter [Curtobacterium flaccumfaciens]
MSYDFIIMTTDTGSIRAHAAPPTTRQQGITTGLLLVLGLLSAVAPFATDLYLPAFPQMTGELQASATTVQLTLTAFLVGVTAGQLVFGPLSDRFGRVPPLIAGAVLCVLASAAAVLAPNVGILVAARLLQGLGGAAGMVIGRAVISDLATGKPAARAFSLMMIVGGVAPVVAPLLGGLLTGPIGWRGLLGIVLGLSVLMLVAVLAVVRETHLRSHRDALRAERQGPGSPLRALRSRTFLGYTAVFGFAFAVMMAYISASPFLYQDMLGLGTVGYGIAFGLNALALMGVSVLSAKLTATRSVAGVLTLGIVLVLASTVAFGLLVATGAPEFWLAVPLFTAVGSLGLVLGNATALALGAVPSSAGSASAVLGALQFGLAALVSPLVSIGGSATAAPLAIVMLAAAVIAVVALLAARGRVREGHGRA